MKHFIIVLLLFSFLSCFSQETADSIRDYRLLMEAQQEIKQLSYRIRQLNIKNSEIREEFNQELYELKTNDSLLERRIDRLSVEKEKLETLLLETSSSFNEEIKSLSEELYEARKRNSIFLIVLFLLLVMNSVYFFSRSYHLKTYVHEEIVGSSLELERRHNKLRKKLKKRFNSFSDSIDKRLKKKRKKKDKKSRK